MNFEEITSRDNKSLKLAVKLQNSKTRKETSLFVLEGLRLCRDAACNGYRIETIFATRGFYEKNPEVTEEISEIANKTYIIDSELFLKISDTKSPQGIACICKIPENSCEVCGNGKYIVLEDTQDPANLGAIARTAEAMGISGILVSSRGCDPFSPKAQRAAMGALLRLPIIRTYNLYMMLQNLKDKGFVLYATVIDDTAELLSNIMFEDSCVMLIGNEANGLTKQAIALCNRKITIPMRGKAESLNAAAAAAVIIWEMTK
ncbi:MAG: RNA methyltransferase [Oscillospiraceae bacterium]